MAPHVQPVTPAISLDQRLQADESRSFEWRVNLCSLKRLRRKRSLNATLLFVLGSEPPRPVSRGRSGTLATTARSDASRSGKSVGRDTAECMVSHFPVALHAIPNEENAARASG